MNRSDEPGQVGPSHSFDLVSPSLARQAIADIFAPALTEMDVVRRWIWARPLSDAHRATVRIQEYKGGNLGVEYGVCCTWVPHLQANTWRWHRTFKQTRDDLIARDRHSALNISRLRGLDALRRQAEMTRDVVMQRAEAWWDSVTSVEGVLREALRQVEESNGAFHPRLVAAFTAVRLGDGAAAREYLKPPRHWADVVNYDGARDLLEQEIAELSSPS